MRSIGAFVLKARQLRNVIYTIYRASGDPYVPRYIIILMILLIGYALSPVDIVPEFIPLIGYLDDLVILSLGIYLVFRLIPEKVKAEYRDKTRTQFPGSNFKWLGLEVIVVFWLLIACWIIGVFWL